MTLGLPLNNDNLLPISPLPSPFVYRIVNFLYNLEGVKRLKKIFVCSPYRGDVKNNMKKAINYCKYVVKQGYLPIAPHLYFPRFLNDNNETERKLGIAMGCELMQDCDEVWVFGDTITEGMYYEIMNAKQLKKPIREIK